MTRHELMLSLERTEAPALFLQIARAIVDHVRHGRLRPGESLPGTRGLARSLGVHRNTVIAAYQELVSEGWIITHRARGTFVSRALPDAPPRPFAKSAPAVARAPDQAAYRLAPGPQPWSTFGAASGTVLSGGKPDLTLVPARALARAYRRTLLHHGSAVLGYGDPRGHQRLRDAIARMLLASRAVPATTERVMVTRGCQMALSLVARALLGLGDVVAVEALGYPPAWEALRSTGARLFPIPVDGSGLQIEPLARLARRERVRAVYVTPHHQCPTTVSLSPGRRMQLLELAREKRFAIIEDDYDHEFHYDGRPLLPLASADPLGNVVYLGTLSKVFAPGLRLGYVVAPPDVIDRVAAHRSYFDLCGDPAMECALAELFEDGEVQRHVRRARRLYEIRRDAMAQALRDHLGKTARFEVPTGGISLWCSIAGRVDVDAWVERCARVGVRFQSGRAFAFDGKARAAVRLGFAPYEAKEIDRAVAVMAKALRA